LGYARNGQAVVFAHGETWTGSSGCPSDYQIPWAREFRYDGARARYLDRKLHGPSFKLGLQVELGATWSDYNGDETYGDYTVTPGSPPTATSTDLYEPGLWRRVNSQARYQHGDHLGTLRLTSTSGGVGSGIRTFTAFGERVAGLTDRFGYVGAFGYQSHTIPESLNPDTAFPYMHVGHRYYDPSSGRFLQRDPIGIWGGLNVYAYVEAIPTLTTDPDGKGAITDWLLQHLVETVGPGFVLDKTGGEGHIPVLDPGTAQDVVQIGAEIVSVAAPVGAAYKTVTATAKTVRALKAGKIGRFIQKLRKYIRYDPAHHGKPPHWDGKIPNALGCGE